MHIVDSQGLVQNMVVMTPNELLLGYLDLDAHIYQSGWGGGGVVLCCIKVYT